MSAATKDQLDVIVVGGVGQMGRHVVRKLVQLNSVGKILVADLDFDRAAILANEFSEQTQPLKLDATDRKAMDEAFSGVDVVINMLGPYNLFGRPILEATIENGKDYIDVCDDWEATVSALEFDSLARERGVRVLLGYGLSPGITNILAMKAAKELDEVHDLFTGWSLAASGVETEEALDAGRAGSGALQHWLLQCAGKIQAWSEGKPAMVDPLEAIEIDYPGAGSVRVYSLGHPEPITLPHSIEIKGRSLNVMSGPEWIFDLLRDALAKYESGELDLVETATTLQGFKRPAHVPGGFKETLPACWALATGTKDGRRVRVAAHLNSYFPHEMGGNTGYPAALAVELIANGRIATTGVLPPEQAADVEDYVKLFAPHVIPTQSEASLLNVQIEELD